MYGRTDGQTGGRTSGRTDGRTDGRADRWTYKLVDRWIEIEGHMTEHAGPRRYECNPVFQIVTREICNLVLKLHNPMKICVTR